MTEEHKVAFDSCAVDRGREWAKERDRINRIIMDKAHFDDGQMLMLRHVTIELRELSERVKRLERENKP